MNSNIRNPFAGCGEIVSGQQFIGRQDSLRVITEKCIYPESPGCLAIIGEPRIGKSSLVYEAIFSQKANLLEQRLLPIWINLGTMEGPKEFFRSLVTSCQEEMDCLGWTTALIERAAQNMKSKDLSWTEEYKCIKRYFQQVRESGTKVLFILDEFDYSRYLFAENVTAFQQLRDLYYYPQWRVAFVTTSRRSIEEIEVQTRGVSISTLVGIFGIPHYLAMFNETDMDQYFGRLKASGLTLSPEAHETVDNICGEHPFLLGLLGYELVHMYRETQVDLDQAVKVVENTFIKYYRKIIELLQEDGTYNKLLQVLFGPAIDITADDITNFESYGLIKSVSQHENTSSEDKNSFKPLNISNITDTANVTAAQTSSPSAGYRAFSVHFHDYLSRQAKSVDIWPLWCKTERALRSLINEVLSQKYGNQWEDKFSRGRQGNSELIQLWKDLRLAEQRRFGEEVASNSLLDYAQPSDLWRIISAEWGEFSSIFKKDKAYWSECFSALVLVRNPAAHNRNLPREEHRLKAIGYCKEIETCLAVMIDKTQPAACTPYRVN